MTRALLAMALVFALTGCSVAQLRPASDAQIALADAERMIVVTLLNPPSAGLRGAGSTWRGWDLNRSYQVGSDVQGAVAELSSRYRLRQVDAWPIGVLGVHCVVFEIDAKDQREALIQRLSADALVETVQPLNEFRTASLVSPSPTRDMQYSLGTMQLEEAHHWAEGRGVRVAVIDTGVDYTHPQLAGRIERHLDLVGGNGAGFAQEIHGTSVAGVIAAASSSSGIVGVAPQAKLLALRACWAQKPAAPAASCNSFTLARALVAAIELNADIVNLSLSGPPDALLTRLVKKALDGGAVVIGALPSSDQRQPSFPTSVAGVIAARSLGPQAQGALPSLAAPGEDIISTAPGATYVISSGSSLAAAHISGVVALLMEHQRGLGGENLRRLLEQSSSPEPGAAGELSVNACNAVRMSLGGAPCQRGAARIH